MNIVKKAQRTCTIHLGIASAEDQSFRMLDYSQKILNIYDDQNYTHYGPNHPKTPGIAFFDKHVQPSKDSQAGLVLTDPVIFHIILELLRPLVNVELLESFRHDS